MRWAIISDTHMPRGNRALPRACVDLMRSADAIVHAGDLMDLPVLRALQALGPPVHAVHGNIDTAGVRALLPEARLLNMGDRRIAVVHDAGPAAGRLERMRLRFPDADAVVFGHSHMPLHEERDGFHIFNPGSPTEKRRAPRHTMGVVTLQDGRLRFEHVALG